VFGAFAFVSLISGSASSWLLEGVSILRKFPTPWHTRDNPPYQG
jgi:hypothetical protein